MLKRMVCCLSALLMLPCMALADIYTAPDGAHIFYQVQGKGKPIVLVHGWTCSGKFWQKNVPELAKDFQVVTIDLRGHGRSSKILTGHTIADYAKDVRGVIEKLKLKDVTLVGWSLGGSIIMTYWDKYKSDSRLSNLVLVDAPLAPMSSGAWNSHGLRDHNWNGLAALHKNVMYDRLAFTTGFTKRMFYQEKISDEDLKWIVDEIMLTPPWIAVGIMSDLVILDTSRILPSVTVPLLVFAADSPFYPKGVEMGRYYTTQVKGKSKLVPVVNGAHMFFYEQPEFFNKNLKEFIAPAKK